MPLAYIRPMGEHGLYHVHIVDAVDPGYGGGRPGGRPDNTLPGMGGPVDPGYGRPGWGGRPDNSLPGGGHIDNTLPGSGGHPDNRPPSRPPVVQPGMTLVLVRDPVGVWHYATIDASTPPPKPVPVPPPDHISNRPPGSGNYPTGGPVPPMPTPG